MELVQKIFKNYIGIELSRANIYAVLPFLLLLFFGFIIFGPETAGFHVGIAIVNFIVASLAYWILTKLTKSKMSSILISIIVALIWNFIYFDSLSMLAIITAMTSFYLNRTYANSDK